MNYNTMPKRFFHPSVAAGLLLLFMGGMMTYEARRDSATMDEAAHIPAGYSYVVKQDMRLNPEHPPLVKFLAGLGIWAFNRNVNFPDTADSWTTNVNDQWGFGFEFLYRSGNDPDRIVFSARLAAILLTLALGVLLFLFARELVGASWALLPLALFSLSPNFIGHGHLVTTDIGASLGVLLGLYALIRYCQNPSRRNFWYAGLGLGIGLLLKFTVVLVIPFAMLLMFFWALVERRGRTVVRSVLWWGVRLIGIGVVALMLVWLAYVWQVWNYPPERQLADTEFNLATYGIAPVKAIELWLVRSPVLRPLGEYGLGLVMNMQRSAGGNTTYFMGEISNRGWPSYFPIVFNLKEPLPSLMLLYATAVLTLAGIRKYGAAAFTKENARAHIAEIALAGFAAFYWLFSITSNLNIGVRHIFPTLPLFYILIAGQLRGIRFGRLLAIPMAIWLLAETLAFAPWHLAYFNEIAGGPSGGYRSVVDSNLDWGQSLKDLRDFVVKNGIEKIKVDYFGGGDAKYYLGDRFEPLNSGMGPQKGWLAISATFLQGERGEPAPGFTLEPCCRYRWLDAYEPVAKIGYSIFVYRID